MIRYLAGRFPETLQVQDDNDRTPLHYAATLADNGHYYNLLLHLGANAKTLDKVKLYNILPVLFLLLNNLYLVWTRC